MGERERLMPFYWLLVSFGKYRHIQRIIAEICSKTSILGKTLVTTDFGYFVDLILVIFGFYKFSSSEVHK